MGTCLVAEKLRKRTELVHAPPPIGEAHKEDPPHWMEPAKAETWRWVKVKLPRKSRN